MGDNDEVDNKGFLNEENVSNDDKMEKPSAYDQLKKIAKKSKNEPRIVMYDLKTGFFKINGSPKK